MSYSGAGGSYRLSDSTLGIVSGSVLIDRHHMTNKREYKHSRRKLDWEGSWNILYMKRDRHENLHNYFDNLRWEVIRDLIDSGKMWRRKKIRNLNLDQAQEALFSIFGKSDPKACVRVMDRISRAKGRNTR